MKPLPVEPDSLWTLSLIAFLQVTGVKLTEAQGVLINSWLQRHNESLDAQLRVLDVEQMWKYSQN